MSPTSAEQDRELDYMMNSAAPRDIRTLARILLQIIHYLGRQESEELERRERE